MSASPTQRRRSINLLELHVGIVRDLLDQGPIPLSLHSADRHEWANRGMTLKQRDAAAAWLCRNDEAAYAVLPSARYSARGHDRVVHLVRANLAHLAEGGR